MDDRMILNEGIMCSFEVPHCLLRQPLGVNAAGCGLPGCCCIVGQGIQVRSHPVVLLLLGD